MGCRLELHKRDNSAFSLRTIHRSQVQSATTRGLNASVQ
jgi:hypothetical protein